MAIIINNGVQNIVGTPGAISGVFGDRPAAPDLADGTLYFSTDTATIYQTVLGVWVTYAGGGGGSSAGINGLNGTATIGLGGTLLNATSILGAGFDLTINNVGKLIMDAAYWNFSNNNSVDTFKTDSVQTFIGCETQVGLGVSFVFDRTNKKIESFYNGSPKGFLLDYNNQTYKIGDTNYLSFVNGISGIRSFINNVEKGILIYGDRVILGDWDNGTLNFNVEIDTGTVYTNYSSQGTNGFILDFVLGQYKLGDYQNQVGGSALLIDAPNANINTFYNGTQIGINLDFANNILQLINSNNYGFQQAGGISAMGDINNASTAFITEISGSRIYAYSNATENGILLNFSNNIYSFGDFGFSGYGLTFDIGFATANLFCSQISILTGNASGFFATGNVSVMGDVDGNGNSTIFEVDDNQQSLIASGNLISSLGNPTFDRLKIKIGGNDYLIVLEQP